MSISRAFTIRHKRITSKDNTKNMPLLTKASLRSLDRPKISAPVLLATTNVDTYSAPSIQAAQKLRKVSSISSNSSRQSDKDSDTSSTGQRSRSTSVTDNSSVGSSPSSPKPLESPRHFTTSRSTTSQPRRAASTADLKRRVDSFEATPLIPQRNPSHTKLAHEQLARKRSLQYMNTWQEPARSVPSTPVRELRSSKDMFSLHKMVDSHHPFGKELEQLDEIAEEFGGAVRDAEKDADRTIMHQKGLAKFSAQDYMFDIEPIFVRYFRPSNTFTAPAGKPTEGWI